MTGMHNNLSTVGNGSAPPASIKTDSDDDIPLSQKLKRSHQYSSSEDDDDNIPLSVKWVFSILNESRLTQVETGIEETEARI